MIDRVAERDPAAGEDARAAVEWVTAGDEEGAPTVFTRRRLQLFLWYELPRKWLIGREEHVAVADALGLFFDELGPQAGELAALCRSPETARLRREGGEGFVEAIEASGLEPPDTPLLEWSDLMTIEESLERDAVAELLERAVDDGQLVPGEKGWKQRQVELVERHLFSSVESGTTPLARIHAARREAWLERVADKDRALLEAATPSADDALAAAEAEAAIEPLLWLLGLLAGGVKLTQTGALPRALVRETVERYPDWWDTELFGPPYREAVHDGRRRALAARDDPAPPRPAPAAARHLRRRRRGRDCRNRLPLQRHPLKGEPGMSTIKVLGSGCANCQRLTKLAEQAVSELGLDAEIIKVTDYAAIAAYGVMSTPALVVDDQVVMAGRIPGLSSLKDVLAQRLAA